MLTLTNKRDSLLTTMTLSGDADVNPKVYKSVGKFSCHSFFFPKNRFAKRLFHIFPNIFFYVVFFGNRESQSEILQLSELIIVGVFSIFPDKNRIE